ncbi:MAG: amino acid permease, partial [Betaproteobacteria bacterium]|nr:amino acid permease [Betaproteobacteria bacterium]
NGVLPAVLARRNRQGTPVIALLVTGVLASLMIWMSYSASLVAAFTLITLMSTAASLPLYLGCALALWVLARRRAVGARSGAALAVATVGLLYGAFAIVGIGGKTFFYALALIAAGLPLYAFMRLRRRTPASAKV